MSATKPTIITLTLPDIDASQDAATILVQRGDLACVHQFTYSHLGGLTEIIADALILLDGVEANPPVIPAAPATPPAKKATKVAASTPVTPAEPTVNVPLKKGTKAVKISHIKIIGGETGAAAYSQATRLAGRLIDGKLWDGESPIRFNDVYRVAKKMKFLTDGDFSLFTLADFVETGEAAVTEVPSATLL